jgi:hypothetical protein
MVKCYITLQQVPVTQDALANKDKKYSGSILPSTYGITLGVNYKNFDLSVDGYGTLEQKCTMVRKHNVFQGKYRRICSNRFLDCK